MLRQFHYIDQNGKDQGINVRNRSKELTELLSDVDKIRSERKKARNNKNKYSGVEGGAGLGGSMSSSSRYGGFGSESAPGGYGGATRQVYGDGGGFGGETVQDDWEERSQSRSRGADRFDEYDEYDEGAAAPSRRKAEPARASTRTTTAAAKKPEPPKPKEPEVDLFDFGDEPVSSAAPSAIPALSANGKQPAFATDDFGALQSGGADDDDFDDFQSAAPAAAPAPAIAAAPKPNYTPNYTSIAPPMSTGAASPNTQFAAPQPRQGANNAAFSNLFSTTSPITGAAAPPPQNIASPMSATQPRGAGFQAAQPNYFTSVSAQTSQPSQPSSAVASPGIKSPIGGAPKPKAGGDAFAALLSGSNLKKSGTPTNKGLTMADMAKQKASAGIWGSTSSANAGSTAPQAGGQKTGGAMDDLLG